MKLLLGIIVLILVAGSLLIDHLWRRWVARQREYRERHPEEFRE